MNPERTLAEYAASPASAAARAALQRRISALRDQLEFAEPDQVARLQGSLAALRSFARVLQGLPD